MEVSSIKFDILQDRDDAMRIFMEGRTFPRKMHATTLANGDYLKLSFSKPMVIALDLIRVSSDCPRLGAVAY